MDSLRVKWVVLILIIGFFTTPAVIVFLEIFINNVSIKESIIYLSNDQVNENGSLLILSAYGLIPFLLHFLFCNSFGKVFNSKELNCYAMIGIVSILSCMIPMHIFAWLPTYQGGRISSTSGLIFMFIPWFCVLSLGLGLCLAWVVTRLQYFKSTHSSQKNR